MCTTGHTLTFKDLQAVKPDLSNFEASDNSAWPSLIDEFVDYMRQQRQQESGAIDLTED